MQRREEMNVIIYRARGEKDSVLRVKDSADVPMQIVAPSVREPWLALLG